MKKIVALVALTAFLGGMSLTSNRSRWREEK